MRIRIETESLGEAVNPAIFMVSGWGMPKEAMRQLALRLSQRFYVVMANLPGISNDEQWIVRTRIGPNYDIDALTQQLIDVAPKECWWIGWSLGGMISTYVAARRSSRVRGLITIASSPSFIKRHEWPHGMEEAEFDAFAELVRSTPEQGMKRFLLLQSKGSMNERGLAKQLQSFLPQHGLNKAALIGGLRLLKSLDVRREHLLLDLPNLHILGENDALVSPLTLEQEQTNILQESVILPDCTHQPFIEYEDVCLHHIEHFIDVHSE